MEGSSEMTPTSACIYCGSPDGPPNHVFGERKCCPDCRHIPLPFNCPACGKAQSHGAVCDDCYRAGKRTPPLSVDPGFLWREWTK